MLPPTRHHYLDLSLFPRPVLGALHMKRIIAGVATIAAVGSIVALASADTNINCNNPQTTYCVPGPGGGVTVNGTSGNDNIKTGNGNDTVNAGQGNNDVKTG